MFIWGLVLFGLGIAAFLDTQFNFGNIFRTANSFMFMLVSLGIMIRTRSLKKLGFREQLIVHNDELKEKVMELRNDQTQDEKAKPVKTTV
ncbi:MAG TPA: hypothetical protein DEO84_05130 [candidate division Zixibacteria bacterium]|jgi:hypothetical protein|nr:hypothetical protein [candidate division Zixibacteria bacterium]